MSSVALVGRAYQNYINSVSLESRHQYGYILKKYMDFHGLKGADELIRQDPKTIEQQIIDYIISQESIARATKSLRLAAIVTFYSINDVILNRKRLGKFLGPRQKHVNDRPYTLEEIEKMLKASDERMRCVVLILTSTGMRIGGLAGLKISSLTKIEEYGLYCVTVYEGSSEEYICFTTPECASAIDFYLNQREMWGEKLKPESPLIRREFDRRDPLSIACPRPIRPRSYDGRIQEMLDAAGVTRVEPKIEGKKGYRKEVSRTTGFRKLVNTSMVRQKVDPLIKEMLLGHHTGLEENYYRPEMQELLDKYLKCVDVLTVNNEFRKQREIDALRVQQTEMQELRAEIDKVKALLGQG
jgi:integrase